MDEFFEILTLVQTKKVQQIPIVLFGSEFWQPLVDYLQKVLLEEFGTVSQTDFDLFTLTDDIDEVLDIVKSAQPRQQYYDPVDK